MYQTRVSILQSTISKTETLSSDITVYVPALSYNHNVRTYHTDDEKALHQKKLCNDFNGVSEMYLIRSLEV